MKVNPFIFCLFIFFIIARNAYANVGLPMITYGFPFMLWLFLPVLIIETIIYKFKLNKGVLESLKVASLANLFTTIIGYPISWFLLMIYQLFSSLLLWGLVNIFPLRNIENHYIDFVSIPLFMPAWIAPLYNYPIYLIICLAGMVGLLPAYWITIYSEKKILRKFWAHDENIESICVLANRTSYLFLLLVIIVGYFLALKKY